MKKATTLGLVALVAFGAGALYPSAHWDDDVVLEIPSEDGTYTLQCTVGMRILNQRGRVVYESDEGDGVAKSYETLLNSGIVWEDNSGREHHFTGKALRKELLKVLRRVLVGDLIG